MYFFDGRYRVEDITAEDYANWQQAAAQFTVNLPSVNTLFPEDLTMSSEEVTAKPVEIHAEPGVSVYLKRSQRFAEPRAEVLVQMYQPWTDKSLREQVAVQVLMDTFNLSQQALAREASIAGTGFRLSASNGLQLTLTGFNDQQGQLASRVLASFAEFIPSENAVNQSADRLRRSVQNQRLQFPMQQMFPAFNQIMRLPSADYQDQIAMLQEIGLDDVLAARDSLLAGNIMRVFVFGNYDNADAIALVEDVKQHVTLDP